MWGFLLASVVLLLACVVPVHVVLAHVALGHLVCADPPGLRMGRSFDRHTLSKGAWEGAWVQASRRTWCKQCRCDVQSIP